MQNNTSEVKPQEASENNYLVLVLESLLIGVITGIVITLFRFSIGNIERMVKTIFQYLKSYNIIIRLLLPPFNRLSPPITAN